MIAVLRLSDNQVHIIANVRIASFVEAGAHITPFGRPVNVIPGVKSARVFDDRGNEVSSWTYRAEGDPEPPRGGISGTGHTSSPDRILVNFDE